jgi:hypothetical protein
MNKIASRRSLFSVLNLIRLKMQSRPHAYPYFQVIEWDIIAVRAAFENLRYAEYVTLLQNTPSSILKLSHLARVSGRLSSDADRYELSAIVFDGHQCLIKARNLADNSSYEVQFNFDEKTQAKFKVFTHERPAIEWGEPLIDGVLSAFRRTLEVLSVELEDPHGPAVLQYWTHFEHLVSHANREIAATKNASELTRGFSKQVLTYAIHQLPQGPHWFTGQISWEGLRMATLYGQARLVRVPTFNLRALIDNFLEAQIDGESNFIERAKEEGWLGFALVTERELSILMNWDDVDQTFEAAIERLGVSFNPPHLFKDIEDLETFIETLRASKLDKYQFNPSSVRACLENHSK